MQKIRSGDCPLLVKLQFPYYWLSHLKFYSKQIQRVPNLFQSITRKAIAVETALVFLLDIPTRRSFFDVKAAVWGVIGLGDDAVFVWAFIKASFLQFHVGLLGS